MSSDAKKVFQSKIKNRMANRVDLGEMACYSLSKSALYLVESVRIIDMCYFALGLVSLSASVRVRGMHWKGATTTVSSRS